MEITMIAYKNKTNATVSKIKPIAMQEFRIAIGFLCIHKQHKNMKYRAAHDRKSVHIVAFL